MANDIDPLAFLINDNNGIDRFLDVTSGMKFSHAVMGSRYQNEHYKNIVSNMAEKLNTDLSSFDKFDESDLIVINPLEEESSIALIDTFQKCLVEFGSDFAVKEIVETILVSHILRASFKCEIEQRPDIITLFNRLCESALEHWLLALSRLPAVIEGLQGTAQDDIILIFNS